LSSIASADGTTISYDRAGDGPPVILVLGAFNDRAAGAPLAAYLSATLTVVNYDRRGRGTSGDTAPYAVDREIDDLEALIGATGGSAAVFGYSSGAVLAMRAAARGLPITKLALYDPPFQIQGRSQDFWTQLARQIDDHVDAGRRGDAVELYQTKAVGIPPDVVAQLRHAPFWPALEAIAPTLAYESLILGCPPELAGSVSTPTLVLHGEASPDPIRAAARTAAEGLPHAHLQVLAGQTHDLVPDVVGPVLTKFYADLAW
jgi:pimeloyl-ACP methyl ester carboxylesterase